MCRLLRSYREDRFRFVSIILLIIVTAQAVTRGQVNAVKVGDPTQPGNLPSEIRKAHEDGATDITIAAGSYDLPSVKTDDTIILDRWKGATIHAAGVTLIFEGLHHRPVSLRHCTNVTWEGGTLLFAKPAFTQGRIIYIGKDDRDNYCDWQIDAGYPKNVDPTKFWFNTVDQKTRLLKLNTGDWTPRRADPIGPSDAGRYRLHYGEKENLGFSQNDWLVERAPGGNNIFHLDNCENCTLQNVILQNGGFGTIFETDGAGGNHYLKCRIEPGPRPAGASEDQLVGCGADGVHSVGTVTGPDFEDCVFSGVFLDDCIAIHGTFSRVISADSGSIVLARDHYLPAAGDPLRISDTHGFYADVTCSAVEELPNHQIRVTLNPQVNVPVDHAQDDKPKLGTKVNNPNRCGRGFKIIRCRLGDTRSRGILVKADDGLIDRCTIEGCGMSGVSLGPEFWWNEANYVQNVTISNNIFRQCSKNNGDQASVWIHGDGAIGNHHIAIENNRFESCFGRYILRLEATDGLEIFSNYFDDSFAVNPNHPGNLAWLNDVTNVKLRNNIATHQGSFAEDLVKLSKSVDPSAVENKGPLGITVQNQ